MNMLEIVKTAGRLLVEVLEVLEKNHFAAVVLIALVSIIAITAIVWRRPARR